MDLFYREKDASGTFRAYNKPMIHELGTSLLYPLLAIAGWLGIVIASAEAIARSGQWGAEASRKVVHIGVGNVILLAWWFQVPAWIGIGAAGLAAIVTLLSDFYPLLKSVSGIGRKSWGTFFYSVTIGILIATFWPMGFPACAVLGVLVMTWGDGLAALVGQRLGKHPYQLWGMNKSWEGSLTMAIASFVIVVCIGLGIGGGLAPTMAIAVIVATVATGLEAFSKYGIDNLTVPLGSAFLFYGLERWWIV
jgi:phytol kinase